MINMPLAIITFALSSAVFAIDLPLEPVPYLSAPVKSVRVVKKVKKTPKPAVHIAKPRLFKLSTELASAYRVNDDDFSDDADDEITIQTITQIKIAKKKTAEININEDVAERLSMIKWIVLARIANPNFHKV